MSGPVRSEDVPPTPAGSADAPAAAVEVTDSHEAVVGSTRVLRALPRRARRTIGAWCFADHMTPTSVTGDGGGLDIGPHPHIGLQTVTWLVAGELLHTDSVGSEQLIRPGQLNLMTAGRGVAHAEQTPKAFRGTVHGMQLWVALPERTRHGEPAFEHHAELPVVELEHATGTVVIGAFGGAASPARRDTDHLGVELALRPGSSTVGLDASHEHGLVVMDGAVALDGHADPPLTPGHLAYLAPGRDELTISVDEPTRALLLGGTPFESPVLMWWNYVARDRAEIDDAVADWNAAADRFGVVASPLARIPSPLPLW